MTTDSNFISLSQLAELLGCSYAAARGRILRAIDLPREYKGNKGSHGQTLVIPLSALLERGWVSEEQVKRFRVQGSGVMSAVGKGTRMMARAIVRKRFEGLLPDEAQWLASVLGEKWNEMGATDRVERLAEVVGRSVAWLYDAPKTESKEKKQLYTTLTNEQLAEVKKLVLTKRKFAQFWRAIVIATAEGTQPLASTQTWRRLWNRLVNELRGERILVQQGPTAHNQSMPNIIQHHEGLQLMQWMSTDYWRVDVVTRWMNRYVTPYLCVVRDERTMKIVGMALTLQPCALGVKAALFHAFSRYGLCATGAKVNMDNGLEFNARKIVGNEQIVMEKRKTSVSLVEVADLVREYYHAGILPAMHVDIHRSRVRMPRGKGVERSFGIGGFSDWAEEMNGWVGRDYWDRPESTAKAWAYARKTGKSEYVDRTTGEIVRFMDYYELCYAIALFVEHLNNRPSNARRLGGMSPNQKWNELALLNPPKPVDSTRLAWAFCDKQFRTVRKNSSLLYARDIEYQNPAALRGYAGQRVMIAWDPLSGGWLEGGGDHRYRWAPSQLLVYATSGEFICQCNPTPVLMAGFEEPAILNAARKEHLGVVRYEREHVKEILASDLPVVADQKSVLPQLIEEGKKRKQKQALDDEREFRRKAKEFGIPGAEFLPDDMDDIDEE